MIKKKIRKPKKIRQKKESHLIFLYQKSKWNYKRKLKSIWLLKVMRMLTRLKMMKNEKLRMKRKKGRKKAEKGNAPKNLMTSQVKRAQKMKGRRNYRLGWRKQLIKRKRNYHLGWRKQL